MPSQKKKTNINMMNLVAKHSYFDKEKPNKWVSVFKSIYQLHGCTHNLHMPYYIHILWSFKPRFSSSQFSFLFINCSTLYVASSSNNHQYHLSLWWTYDAKPIFLSVLLTSLETIFCPWCSRFQVFFFFICHAFFRVSRV